MFEFDDLVLLELTTDNGEVWGVSLQPAKFIDIKQQQQQQQQPNVGVVGIEENSRILGYRGCIESLKRLL
jgi:hypothetical protein